MQFTASASTTEVSLLGAAGQKYIGLDNVDVVAVPEPASLVLWSVLGMVGVGYGWWRKRRPM